MQIDGPLSKSGKLAGRWRPGEMKGAIIYLHFFIFFRIKEKGKRTNDSAQWRSYLLFKFDGLEWAPQEHLSALCCILIAFFPAEMLPDFWSQFFEKSQKPSFSVAKRPKNANVLIGCYTIWVSDSATHPLSNTEGRTSLAFPWLRLWPLF